MAATMVPTPTANVGVSSSRRTASRVAPARLLLPPRDDVPRWFAGSFPLAVLGSFRQLRIGAIYIKYRHFLLVIEL
jgi:hypothetical protein